MASAAAAATTSATFLSSATPGRSSFFGRTPSIRAPASLRLSPNQRLPASVRAELNPSIVISLSTGVALFLGRFVFFNFQRENVAKQVPKQNGLTHFDAGDTRAAEFDALLKSNDPVGFNIVDVLAWGSLGHIVAYYILATSSNGYDPTVFGSFPFFSAVHLSAAASLSSCFM